MESRLSRRSSILMSVETRTAPCANGASCMARTTPQDLVQLPLDDGAHGGELVGEARVAQDALHVGDVGRQARRGGSDGGDGDEDDGHGLTSGGRCAGCAVARHARSYHGVRPSPPRCELLWPATPGYETEGVGGLSPRAASRPLDFDRLPTARSATERRVSRRRRRGAMRAAGRAGAALDPGRRLLLFPRRDTRKALAMSLGARAPASVAELFLGHGSLPQPRMCRGRAQPRAARRHAPDYQRLGRYGRHRLFVARSAYGRSKSPAAARWSRRRTLFTAGHCLEETGYPVTWSRSSSVPRSAARGRRSRSAPAARTRATTPAPTARPSTTSPT